MNFCKLKSLLLKNVMALVLVFLALGARPLSAALPAGEKITGLSNKTAASQAFIAVALAASAPASPKSSDQGTKISEFPKSPILGKWKFYKMSIDGSDMPPRDQRMELTFTFDEEGVSTLYWSYDGGATFCERKGRYLYQDGFLIDEIFWANPKNKFDCAGDPDMQVGRRSTSKVDLSDDEFILYIPFSSKEILYYWKKLEE